MSAIFFIFDKSSNDIKYKSEIINSSLDSISHRGNQKKEVFFEKDKALGFKRLKTSSYQIQPYVHKNNQLVIVIDGEIYNESEIINKSNISTKNINEALANIYLKSQNDIIKDLNGMFTICIFDIQKSRVVFIKDKLGSKPLFYYEDSKQFICASEIKAIKNFLGNLKVDYSCALNSIFLAGRPPYGKTHFKNVNDLEQACTLTYDFNIKKINIEKYFEISSYISESEYIYNSKRKDSDIANFYHELFYEIIKGHLNSELHIGNLFSAGLDSSMVGAYMSQISDNPLNLYYFESELHDYSYFTNLYCKKFNANLVKLKTDDKKFVSDIPNMVYHYESTAKEEGAPIMHLASEAIKNNNPILLTGDGDTILGGSAAHTSYFVRSALYNNKLTNFFIKLLNHVFTGLMDAGASPSNIDYLYFPAFLNMSEVLTNLLLFRGERLQHWKESIERYEFVENKTERETQAFILDDTLYRFQRYFIRQDRSASRYSCQFRYPYLDDRIIKSSVNMPLRLKQKFNFFQFGERFGKITEAKAIVRDIALLAGTPKKIVYRNEVGSPFNSSAYFKKIIQKWSFQNLSNLLDVKEKLLVQAALESSDPWIDRVRYSFIANEILIRIFEMGEKPEEIQSEIKFIIK